MKILNSNEAYAALMAGKNILCRAVGDLIDFDDLDQFPATVFAKADYEFCIKIETMELAGITFTKPLTLEDIVPDMDIYVVQPDGIIHHHKYNGIHSGLSTSITGGFAQRDFDNAKLHYEAVCKVVGGTPIQANVVSVTTDQPKQKRNTVKKANNPTPAAANDASVSVEKKTLDKSEIQITKQGPVTTVKETLSKDFIETDAVKLVEKFTAQIQEFTKTDDVLSFRHVFLANGHLDQNDQQHLCKLCEDKLLELDPEQYTPKAQPQSDNLTVDQLKQLQVEAENLIKNGIGQQVEDDHEHQEHLEILLNDIALAKTPIEANAQIKYTKSWTQEQRKPVMQAINKRLIELKAMEEPKSEETPSLMVQIQNAPDLTALDVLEIDVGSRHSDIQSKLMGYVKRRRFELENGAGPIGAPL